MQPNKIVMEIISMLIPLKLVLTNAINSQRDTNQMSPWLQKNKINIGTPSFTNSGSTSSCAALKPTILNIMILENMEVKEFVRQTISELVRLLYLDLL